MEKTIQHALQYTSALLFLLTAILNVSVVHAQEGTVTYEEVIKLNIELPPEMAQMADEIPNSRTSKQVLYFNESAALLKNAPEAEEEQDLNSVKFSR